MTRTESRIEIIKLLYQINLLDKTNSKYELEDLYNEVDNINDFI